MTDKLDICVFENGKKFVSLGKLDPAIVNFLLEKSPQLSGTLNSDTDILFWKARIKHTELHKDDFISDNEFYNCLDKTCVLAEELGHYHTTVGDILDQSKAENRKQELRARIWAYNKLIGLRGIVDSYIHGCCSIYETAECLGVTEEFLTEAIHYYKSKYGIYTNLDNYVIYFDPTIAVFELI